MPFSHQCVLCATLRCAAQAYVGPVVGYNLGGRLTSQILALVVANATYIASDVVSDRRVDEVFYHRLTSRGPVPLGLCDSLGPGSALSLPALGGAASNGTCSALLESYALFDWKWQSQLTVSRHEYAGHEQGRYGSTQMIPGFVRHKLQASPFPSTE
jgi:hypothetical protein